MNNIASYSPCKSDLFPLEAVSNCKTPAAGPVCSGFELRLDIRKIAAFPAFRSESICKPIFLFGSSYMRKHISHLVSAARRQRQQLVGATSAIYKK
jgi:hypothetical protein